jgi:queuine tRNA-ribosyltransferase
LRHLFAANEYLGKQVATLHNLGFYLWLVKEARTHILNGTISSWKEVMVKQVQIRL